MNEKIKKIIEELCELDPELKGHEKELEKVISKFLESRPETMLNEQFIKELKQKVLSGPVLSADRKDRPFLTLFNMKRNYLVLSGALAVFVIAIATVQYLPGQKRTATVSVGGVSITKLAGRSFGSLSGSATADGGVATAISPRPEAAPSAMPAFGRGGGGGGTTENFAAAASSVAPDAKMMIYRPYQIKYIYKGEEVSLSDKALDVLRRTKPDLNTGSAAGVLSGFGFGGLNLGSFSGSKVTSFELMQSDGDGYIVNVNLRDGNIYINKNYIAEKECPKGVCPPYVPLRPSEMLSDEQLISVSKSFLKDHGIDVANYGEPVVENDFLKNIETTSPAFAPYIPDEISVVFPLKVNGSELYDLGGGVNGMRVNVSVRKKAVQGVWNIVNQNYESSSYEAETDGKAIVKIAENGGIYGGGYQDPNAEIVEVELGTPKKVFTTVWRNDGSGEVIVPALSFPVVKAPKGNQYYFQKAIVVPLIKELLQVPEQGPIQIMRGGAEPAVLNTPKGL